VKWMQIVKGLVHSKIKMLLTLMLFQTHKTFIYLQITNKDLFDEIWELSVPSYLRLQKVYKEISKLIHMNWAVKSKFSEETQSWTDGIYSQINMISSKVHVTENKPHWFSNIKQTCLSFHLLQLMCELMNMWIKA